MSPVDGKQLLASLCLMPMVILIPLMASAESAPPAIPESTYAPLPAERP